VRAKLWPLFHRSAWAEPASVLAGTTGEGAELACSPGRRGFSQPVWRRARQVRALLWPLFDRLAWAQPAKMVADTTDEGAAPASVSWVDVV
jgi:hypothetical protein